MSVSGTNPGTMPTILNTNGRSINCFAAYDRKVPAYPLQGLQVDLSFASTLLSTSSANSFKIFVGVKTQSDTGLNRRHHVQDLYQSRSRNNTYSFRSGPNKSFLSTSTALLQLHHARKSYGDSFSSSTSSRRGLAKRRIEFFRNVIVDQNKQ